MRLMGGAVLKGGFTTFLGTLILSFTSSLIFRTFFKLLFSTVVLGVLHGLYFAPVALRVRRPRHSRASGREKTQPAARARGYDLFTPPPLFSQALTLVPPLPWERQHVPASVVPPSLAPAYEKGRRTEES